MISRRIRMGKLKEILRLYKQGLSYRKIAVALAISKPVVSQNTYNFLLNHYQIFVTLYISSSSTITGDLSILSNLLYFLKSFFIFKYRKEDILT